LGLRVEGLGVRTTDGKQSPLACLYASSCSNLKMVTGFSSWFQQLVSAAGFSSNQSPLAIASQWRLLSGCKQSPLPCVYASGCSNLTGVHGAGYEPDWQEGTPATAQTCHQFRIQNSGKFGRLDTLRSTAQAGVLGIQPRVKSGDTTLCRITGVTLHTGWYPQRCVHICSE